MKYTGFGLCLISLILSVLIGLTLARGKPSHSQSADRSLLIGFSMDTLKEARWQKDRDYFVARAQALGAQVKVNAANSDDSVQLRDIQSFISDRVDVLVIVPHDGKAMSKAVQLAHAAGIPVIAYDRLITDCDLDLYTTFDNVRVGEVQAQYLVDKMGGSGRILRIYGAPTDNNAKLYKLGQDHVLNPLIEKGLITVVHEDWAENWEPQKAKQIVNAAITNHGHAFDGILASNDGTASGAIQALKEEGLAGKKWVTGQDAELAACQSIVEGTQTMTIYKPIRALAEGAAELAFQMGSRQVIIARDSLQNGFKEVPAVYFPVIAVDAQNLRETVVQDGFHTAQQVYGTEGP
ncbi:MAG: substrate-binding domain-containing protein [Acidobacteria bacterium]|nr:substrate-binding domain-containing protein [Acidobacteriota bacterium]MCB9398929.1 substrate-binding domain-containing protein [Acidobacteriota bacterium]